MELLLLRHGQTETNVKQLTHKHGEEVGLDTIGRKQAQELAEVCQRHGIQALYCSPELRAVETASIIGSKTKIQPIILEALTERHWGDWEGQPWSEIQARLQPMSVTERYEFFPPNGESWQQMEQRLLGAINSIITQDKTAAVVTHGGALRAIMPPLKKEPLSTSLAYDFHNASVTIFDTSSGELIPVLENDLSHLRA